MLKRVLLALLLLALAGSGLFFARPILTRAFDPPLDLECEGAVLNPDQSLAAFVRARASEVAGRSAHLLADPGLIRVDFPDLGLSLSEDETLSQAREMSTARGLFGRLRRALGPPRVPPTLSPVYEFDRQRARAFLTGLAPGLLRDPVDARLDLKQHRRVHARSGRRLDVERSLLSIEQGEREPDAVFSLKFTTLEPKVKDTALGDVRVERVLSRFETDFAHKAGARAVNIARAARYLNGRVLEPGEALSFNRTVGRRSQARGFVWAPVIVRDEMEPGLGGGVCQVATTLHAAAVLGGLTILERRSHSRPSGYAPLGLDATVVEDKVDLRFENPYPEPIMIHAFLPSRTRLRIELLGRDPPGRIEHSAVVIERHDFYRRVFEKADLSPGTFERKQKGGFGYDILSVVRTTLDDGTVQTRRYPSTYYPVPEVFWVGPGTEPSALPELPEHATHTEVGTEPEADGEVDPV